MDASPSPQLLAVGEDFTTKNLVPKEVAKQSYASTLQNKQSDPSKTELCPIFKENGEPVIQFTWEEVDNFIMEEGLHQAAVLKFSYNRPNLAEVRKIFSSQFEVQGHCNIGQLEFRHILIRFDLYNDYVHFLSKSVGFLKSKGDEFFFRTFPWTLNFNPKEETSMAVVWISLPGLPPNFFVRRSLLSIASVVGKPLAIDKATQDRTRPSAARVKIIVDLLANHPKTIKLQILDKLCGKTVDFHQEIVFDNMPKYCVLCKHQGHDEKACRFKKSQPVAEVQAEGKKSSDLIGSELGVLEKLQGDAREFLNAKRSGKGFKELQKRKVYKQVWNVKVGQVRSAEKFDIIEKTGSDPNGISIVNPADANALVEAAVSNVNTRNQVSQNAERDILDESRMLVSTHKMLDKMMPTDDSQNSIMKSKTAAIDSHIDQIPVSSSKESDSIMESKAAAVSNAQQVNLGFLKAAETSKVSVVSQATKSLRAMKEVLDSQPAVNTEHVALVLMAKDHVTSSIQPGHLYDPAGQSDNILSMLKDNVLMDSSNHAFSLNAATQATVQEKALKEVSGSLSFDTVPLDEIPEEENSHPAVIEIMNAANYSNAAVFPQAADQERASSSVQLLESFVNATAIPSNLFEVPSQPAIDFVQKPVSNAHPIDGVVGQQNVNNEDPSDQKAKSAAAAALPKVVPKNAAYGISKPNSFLHSKVSDSLKSGKEYNVQTESDQKGNEDVQFSQATQAHQQSKSICADFPTDHNSFDALVNSNDENENHPATKIERAESNIDKVEAVGRIKDLNFYTKAATEVALQQQKEDEERYRLKRKAVAPYVPSSQKKKNYFLRNIAIPEPRQSERNWNREGIYIRMLPMRKAKQDQVDQKSKNK